MAKKESKPENVTLSTNYLHVYQGKVQKVSVGVHINYATGIISLVDTNQTNPHAVQGKQWIFRNRGLEFMQGWQDILDAMKSAISDATEKLQAYIVANPPEELKS